jgi:hypothetical protein
MCPATFKALENVRFVHPLWTLRRSVKDSVGLEMLGFSYPVRRNSLQSIKILSCFVPILAAMAYFDQ